MRMKPPTIEETNAESLSTGEYLSKTQELEAELERLERLTVAIESGELTDELLAECPSLAKMKRENEKLKYRCGILEQSIKEEEARCKTANGGDAKKVKKPKAKDKTGAAGDQQQQATKATKKQQSAKDGQQKSAEPTVSYKLKYITEPDGLLSELRRVFAAAIQAAFPNDDAVAGCPLLVAETNRANFGDYQCNSAMSISQALAKSSGKKVNPRVISEQIIAKLAKTALIEKVEIAGPGFINIHLCRSELERRIGQLLVEGFRPPQLKRLRAVVDFSSPNIAKQMHVGHLRSTILGDCICNLLEYVGLDVVRLNHIGDWGTQFGMLIAHLQDKYPNYANELPPLGDVQEFYKESKVLFDSDEAFKKRAYECVVSLQSYEENIVKAWKLICDVSMKANQAVYDRLGVKIETRGESFYQKLMDNVVADIKQKDHLKLEDGRWLMFPPGCEVPLTVVKSDGGYTYDTSDLAALKHRLEEEKADWIVYVTDMGQSLHFEQIFAAGRLMDWYRDEEKRVIHVGFGMVLGEDKKKFKTRSGDTVILTDLLDEGLSRAEAKLKEKERDLVLTPDELLAARDAVAYGCIKYADLAHSRQSDYVFSFDRMLDDKGNTAVYLLYANTRIRSIARNAKVDREKLIEFAKGTDGIKFEQPSEIKLAKTIVKLPDVLSGVLESLYIHPLCDYLYELASVFSDFYTECRCIEMNQDATLKHIHLHRLVLCETTADTMDVIFRILGINTVPKM